jgi:protocatechuate 3,4-dioxygenase beta subunit
MERREIMTSRLQQDLAASLDRRRLLGGMALGLGSVVLAACGSRAGAQPGAEACPATPTETKGPFPADGSNGRPRPINVLEMDGVNRHDIRGSFAGMDGVAEGAPLELELKLADGGCRALAGHAIYLWQNDAAGAYSLYNLPAENYLRGMQEADGDGVVRFTSIVPGCYGGRYPHCHFEVFASAEGALRGDRPLLVSQLAFPADQCRPLYRDDARYGDSLRNLERMPIERDFVFADADEAGRERQTIVMTGDAQAGYRGTAAVAIRA